MEENKRVPSENTPGGEENRTSGARTGRKRPAGRPRKQKSIFLSIFLSFLYVLAVIGVSAVLATLGWVWANDVLALNKEMNQAVITVENGESFDDVVSELADNGIIEYEWLFHLFAWVTDGEGHVTPGSYTLDTEMDYRAILTGLSSSSGNRVEISVTIPEGYTALQIFELLEAEGVSTVDLLKQQAASYDYNFSFLQEVPLGDYRRLEGYLFPDTYRFYIGEDPKTVLNKMIVNFDAKFTDDMREEAAELGYTVHEMVIIASMIEKETDGTDQTHISSVIFNRLNGTATNGLLNIDATIQYILPERKEYLTFDDLAIDDPYNTYLYAGLPAGPIANPGMASILSAFNPMDTNDYYYALGDDGEHHFFQTADQHQAFIDSQELYN